MIKLAFSTLPCEEWSLEKILKCCRANDIQGIEIREGLEPFKALSDPGSLDGFVRDFNQYSVTVTDIGSGICIRGVDTEAEEMLFGQFCKLVQTASVIGAKGIRIFLGNFYIRLDAYRGPMDFKGIVSWVQKACDFAKGYGVEVWIETHNEFATGRSLAALLKEIDRNNCGVIWDVIHPLEERETPEDTLKYLGEKIRHIHIKDGRLSEDIYLHDWTYTALGAGSIDIRHIVSLLNKAGYEGYFSLEWESKWRKELQLKELDITEVIPQFAAYMRERFLK